MLSFDTADKLATVGLSVSSILFYIFYNRYKHHQLSADQVKAAVDVELGSDLKRRLQGCEDHKIAYAKIEGVVTSLGRTLFSQYDSTKEGVLVNATLEELKSRRVNGFWSDVRKVLRSIYECVPFALTTDYEVGSEIYITDVADADFLMDDLSVTYDRYQPNNASLLQVGLDRVLGDISKGLHEKERMLLVGTHLVGFGEVFMENGKVKFGPGQGTKYILTKLSKNEVIKSLKSQSTIFKVLMVIWGCFSSGFLIYLIWKHTKKYTEERRNRQIFEEARLGLTNAERSGENSECVICLENPRDIVILNCGHVAICSSCAQMLPTQLCPVCRNHIEKFVPLYQS
ncbi:hypothetical protein LOTGIDRAFT_208864 [Lottia gigantea]|uniref:RING-type E3 ubiquitin transferase n=1 Tax=Lottia gigantea TaxID=225164 RepID=V4AKS6_LOTGI|nr:hypothetical protein LOTGIDRAFT_208864 [Lottia gigantea]ESO97727.1 hypothetical protein LOTGIDRAFT_208864 [Lottia gigantea]